MELNTDYKAVYINPTRKIEPGNGEIIAQLNLHSHKESLFALWWDHSSVNESSVVIWRIKSLKN